MTAVAGALLALVAGVIGTITGQAAWAVTAGAIGFAVGCFAVALANHARMSDDQLVRANKEVSQLRRDVEILQTIVAEQDASPAADGGLPTVAMPAPATPATASTVTTADELNITANDEERVFDEHTGLLDERFFAVNVQQRVAAARRQLQPVSIVIFEIDGAGENDRELRDNAMSILGDVLRRTLRECDAACRIGEVMAAAVLEDTTEAGAVWAAERVRGSLNSSAIGNSLTVSAGVACYPSHALDAPELVAMAGRALEIARGRGRDQVEIAPSAE